jgi:hypothetical protein
MGGQSLVMDLRHRRSVLQHLRAEEGVVTSRQIQFALRYQF